MVSTEQTQSLTDFRQNATQTLDRLNKTGESAILTVNGEARAVLVPPTVYDALARDAQLTRDIAVMRQAKQQIDEGEGEDVADIFAGLRRRLIKKKGKKRVGK